MNDMQKELATIFFRRYDDGKFSAKKAKRKLKRLSTKQLAEEALKCLDRYFTLKSYMIVELQSYYFFSGTDKGVELLLIEMARLDALSSYIDHVKRDQKYLSKKCWEEIIINVKQSIPFLYASFKRILFGMLDEDE